MRSYTDSDVQRGECRYELEAVCAAGSEIRSLVVTVKAGDAVPLVRTSIKQNFPNPFNTKTTIEYTLGERSRVSINIFDVSGALVKKLEQGEREPGEYQTEWNGTDTAGLPVPGRVYFYRLSGAPESVTQRMVLLK